MTQTSPTAVAAQLPRTLEEFLAWEPNDGLKYEWNDGELIKFNGMKKEQLYIYDFLLDLFLEKGCQKTGTLVAEQDVMLNGIQMRRPDVAYFTKQQIAATRNGDDVIPEFVIEIISNNDQINQVEKKIAEYFKAGVKVVWNIIPEEKVVYVYTSRQNVKICLENDICSAAPVLPDFELSVNALLDTSF
ncbi:MAG: Uma2 family endonuclease [Runella slithyformis]|nr:MAG: Uma2 family endonuclease [Runella slithyformis]TAF24454.1 MAG: Uma2 family endonuclease [Runella slithyformis]TAF49409.1 MAG: Uma2 family endonuclease [Runella slithyformis]